MNFSHVIARVRNRCQRDLSSRFGRRIVNLKPSAPIVSFTFDDFPDSALHQAGEILKRYNVRGTYYVSLGLMGQKIPAGRGFSHDDLKQVVGDGHELGCHTFAHCHSWDTKPAAFENSILENKRVLAELVPGAVFKTLSYPIACARPETKRRASNHYPCCRGGGENLNFGPTDVNNLQSCFLEKNTSQPEKLIRLIEENNRKKGWLIFSTHDVCEQPTPYGCQPAFFEKIVQESIASGASILPVGKAWETLTAGRVTGVLT